MSLVAFERAMTEWRARLAAMSRNISDLGDLVDTPECADIKSRMRSRPDAPGAEPNLTNAAARAWKATQEQLWECTKSVGEMVDRAEQTVRAAWPWQRDEAARHAMLLLSTEHVELPQGDVSVLGRSLLDAAQDVRRLTLEEMLGVMGSAFERGKEGLVSLVAAYKDIDSSVAAMSVRVAALEATGWPGAAQARALLEQGRLKAEADPLRALGLVGAEVGPMVERAVAEAAAHKAARVAAGGNVGSAATDLASLLKAEKAVSALRDEAAAKVSLPPVAQADRGAMRELAAWLGRLERMLREGASSTSVGIGAENWSRMRAMLSDSLDGEGDAYRRAMARREELRGRFGAIEAKRRARVAAGAADDGRCASLGERLKSLLFGAVTPLSEAERLFCEYETQVSRLAAARTSMS